jgi:hypothetical protein
MRARPRRWLRSLNRRVAPSRPVQALLRSSQQQPDAASRDRRVFVRAVLAESRTRVRVRSRDGKEPGPSPAAISGPGWHDESAQSRATCPPAPASFASLCHRTPSGNVFHVGRCRSQRSEPLPRLHSNEDSHRFTDEIGLVRSWISNFQCLAVELIVDRDRRSHIVELPSSELMHNNIIYIINEAGAWQGPECGKGWTPVDTQDPGARPDRPSSTADSNHRPDFR